MFSSISATIRAARRSRRQWRTCSIHYAALSWNLRIVTASCAEKGCNSWIWCCGMFLFITKLSKRDTQHGRIRIPKLLACIVNRIVLGCHYTYRHGIYLRRSCLITLISSYRIDGIHCIDVIQSVQLCVQRARCEVCLQLWWNDLRIGAGYSPIGIF